MSADLQPITPEVKAIRIRIKLMALSAPTAADGTISLSDAGGLLAVAALEIRRLCGDGRGWRMSVPAQQHDSDILLTNALLVATSLLEEVGRLTPIAAAGQQAALQLVAATDRATKLASAAADAHNAILAAIAYEDGLDPMDGQPVLDDLKSILPLHGYQECDACSRHFRVEDLKPALLTIEAMDIVGKEALACEECLDAGEIWSDDATIVITAIGETSEVPRG